MKYIYITYKIPRGTSNDSHMVGYYVTVTFMMAWTDLEGVTLSGIARQRKTKAICHHLLRMTLLRPDS